MYKKNGALAITITAGKIVTKMTWFKGIGQDDRINPVNKTKEVVLKKRFY
jgi:hypothetical protein